MVRLSNIVAALSAGACVLTSSAHSGDISRSLFQIRGGLVPQADEAGGDYYEQFELDYGTADKKRVAGATRGFIRSGKLAGLPESDPFQKWLNQHIEKGAEPISGRVKPFYAADFGTKADLKFGEHPKILIVSRRLTVDEDGVLESAPIENDVEVRTVWQPWLRHRCDFAVRYIVPSRVGIIRILEAKKRFSHEIEIDDTDENDKKLWSKMTFRPSLIGRFKGKRDRVVWRGLDVPKGNAEGVSKKGSSSSLTKSFNPVALLNEGKAKVMKLLKK